MITGRGGSALRGGNRIRPPRRVSIPSVHSLIPGPPILYSVPLSYTWWCPYRILALSCCCILVPYKPCRRPLPCPSIVLCGSHLTVASFPHSFFTLPSPLIFAGPTLPSPPSYSCASHSHRQPVTPRYFPCPFTQSPVKPSSPS